jgi:PAS domain S-box-containing protein
MRWSAPSQFDNNKHAKVLLAERARYLYEGLGPSLIISALLAVMLVVVEWSVNPLPVLLAWLALMGLLLTGRAILVMAWFRSDDKDRDCLRWVRDFRVGAIAAGMVWGLGAVLLFPSGAATQQVLLAFVLAGLCAGAITSLGVDRVSSAGFLLPTLVPLIIRFGVEGGLNSWVMAGMIILFLVFVGGSSMRIKRSLEENFWRRIESGEREQALMLSDERMNQAQQLAQLGSFDWNPVSGALAWSDEHFRLWGLQPNAITPSHDIFLQGIHPDDVALVDALLQRALKGERVYDCVHRVRWPDGSEHHIHGRGEVMFDGNGKARQMIGTVQDISERMRTQQALIAAKEEAEQASRAKSLFLASMSHELRTPLNSILGYAQLMELTPHQSDDTVENAREIRRAGELLLALMSDVLDLAKMESGRLEMQIETFALSEAVDQCHAQNIRAAQVRNIMLQPDRMCGSILVTADRRRLVQVVDNLISNAIKYTQPGGTVTVSCGVVASGRVRVTVTDTGAGLSVEQQAKMFQPFNRLGSEMSQVEGRGIGLAIARRLAQAMEGDIGFESQAGRGSTFWIELPASSGRLLSAPASEPLIQQPARVVRSGGARVLVAEDYLPNQNVLRQQLKALGCHVDIASDGAQALGQWRTAPYDLILTDLNMPVMNGLEFTLAVRQQEREGGGHIPIVAITAAAISSELQRCRDAGMDDVMTKPVSLEDLRAVLARWTAVAPAPLVPAATGTKTIATGGQTKADANILDLDHLYRILGQVNSEQAHDLVNTFLKSAREGLASLVARDHDPAAVAREMHKQKSPARIVGALHYASLAEALEQQAKSEAPPDLGAPLAELAKALAEVAAAFERLQADTQEAHFKLSDDVAQGVVSFRSALVIDDDPVVLMQMSRMLSSLGVPDVLTAASGQEALKIIDQRAEELEVLVCDLSMPEMDGVELIRRFGQTGFKGGLILMSGAGAQVLSTASTLAVLQGLRVLGQAQKPVTLAQMSLLLSGALEAPIHEHPVWAFPEVSPEAIRQAIAKQEFSIWFQPKVDTWSLKPTGVEALARWRLPDGSFVPPEIFITLAEREGLIAELSQLLVSTALQDGARLHQAGFPLKIAVNLSGVWLDDLSLPDFMLNTAKRTNLQARDIILEVTETGVMSDVTTALDVLTRMRLKGFGLSIDDFGIGYSSFEQLGRIPFTEMKLDRAFVGRGSQDAAARAILESSMGMAQKLGLTTVAEGVETQADLELMRALACDNVQGYLIARPMQVDELMVWLGNTKKA